MVATRSPGLRNFTHQKQNPYCASKQPDNYVFLTPHGCAHGSTSKLCNVYDVKTMAVTCCENVLVHPCPTKIAWQVTIARLSPKPICTEIDRASNSQILQVPNLHGVIHVTDVEWRSWMNQSGLCDRRHHFAEAAAARLLSATSTPNLKRWLDALQLNQSCYLFWLLRRSFLCTPRRRCYLFWGSWRMIDRWAQETRTTRSPELHSGQVFAGTA